MNRRDFCISLASVVTFPNFGFANCEDPNSLADQLIAFSKTCKIPTANGLKYFNPRPYQTEYFKRLVNSPMLVCKKCRQCGATTMNLIYANWKASLHKNHHIVVCCYSRTSADIERIMFENMHEFDSAANVILFVSCGQLISILHSKDTKLRDLANDVSNTTFIFDEYAFYGSSELNALIEKISKAKDSQVIVASTRNTHLDAFSKLFDETDKSSRYIISGYDAYDYYKFNEIRSAISDRQFAFEYNM